MRATLALSLVLPTSFAMAALAGCYTVDFDQDAGGVYYCVSDVDCNADQACSRFTCVDDLGPAVKITAPEVLQNLAFGSADLNVSYSASDFTVSDANAVVEGEGKMLVKILGTELEVLSVISQGAQLDITSLAPGAYRVSAQAVYGDGTPYDNPSATAFSVFYLEAESADRPQTAIVSPVNGYVHLVGEDLDIEIAVRNFEFVANGEDCRIGDGCDPWAVDATCAPVDCEFSAPTGHAHVYTLSDYPACLSNEITCNGDYVLSMRPNDNVGSDGVTATATIPADRFETAGTYTFSIGLQYNDHEPYPNDEFIVYDQLTIEVVD